MKVIIWGSRGSLPAALDAQSIREKILHVLEAAAGQALGDAESREKFLDSLPFSLRGTYGGNSACVQVEGAEDYVICDAGSGIRELGHAVMRLNEAPRHFHIFISHLHLALSKFFCNRNIKLCKGACSITIRQPI